MPFHVKELWRYPVKSLRGESLQRTEIRADGVAGDRLVVVHNGLRAITSRTKPRLLGLRGTLRADGVALIDGLPWDAPESLEAVRRAAGPEAEVTYHEGTERFDVLPLLVATDGAIAEFGRDGRRLRPNIVLGDVPGLAERYWEGRRLRIGDVVIVLDSLRSRCVMTTFDPDTLAQDVDVLRDINARFDGKIALNAAVERPGAIAVGDSAELL